jgi:hypothetical protein
MKRKVKDPKVVLVKKSAPLLMKRKLFLQAEARKNLQLEHLRLRGEMEKNSSLGRLHGDLVEKRMSQLEKMWKDTYKQPSGIYS